MRKFFVWFDFGLLKKVFFGEFLIILFLFIKIIWFVILWVKFILWVIIIMVIFLFVSFIIMFSILLIIFGFSVDVGLLNSIVIGFIYNVWVIVICCCWLLESCVGNLLVWVESLICFSSFRVFLWVGVLLCLSIFICVRVRFLIIDRWGNSLKCWNIILMWECSFVRFVFLLLIMILLMVILFCCIGLRLLMVLISVDLLELDGL